MAVVGSSFMPNASLAQKIKKIPLKPVAVSHGAFIKLSELLPAEAPASLRSAAEEVDLGKSPLPGSHRILAGDQIFHALESIPSLRGAFDIPASVDVTRWSRLLTSEEVLLPVRETLIANDLLETGGNLTTSDLSFAAPVIVTEKNPRLEVTRIESIPAQAVTRVGLWTPSEPRLAPFVVTIDRMIATNDRMIATHDRKLGAEPTPDVTAGAGKGHSPAAADAALVAVSVPVAPPPIRNTPRSNIAIFESSVHNSVENPVVIKVGQRVELVAQASGMRLTAAAISLEAGRRGEKIRVHVAMNGKTLLATIIDARTVQIDY